MTLHCDMGGSSFKVVRRHSSKQPTANPYAEILYRITCASVEHLPFERMYKSASGLVGMALALGFMIPSSAGVPAIFWSQSQDKSIKVRTAVYSMTTQRTSVTVHIGNSGPVG
jgi:hypothetical protein